MSTSGKRQASSPQHPKASVLQCLPEKMATESKHSRPGWHKTALATSCHKSPKVDNLVVVGAAWVSGVGWGGVCVWVGVVCVGVGEGGRVGEGKEGGGGRGGRRGEGREGVNNGEHRD